MKSLALLTLAFCIQSAFAGDITTYSDRATFDVAVGTTTLETFTNTYHFPIPNGVLNSSSAFGTLNAGDIKSGVTYSSPVGSGNYFNIDGGTNLFAGGFLDGFDPSDRDLTITFDSPQSALGFDTNSTFMPNFDITINFVSGLSYSGNFNVNSAFYGYQSNLGDINSLIISGNNSFFGFAIDNFAFGGTTSTDATVPEPTSIALLGLGLFSFAASRRKSANSKNA